MRPNLHFQISCSRKNYNESKDLAESLFKHFKVTARIHWAHLQTPKLSNNPFSEVCFYDGGTKTNTCLTLTFVTRDGLGFVRVRMRSL